MTYEERAKLIWNAVKDNLCDRGLFDDIGGDIEKEIDQEQIGTIMAAASMSDLQTIARAVLALAEHTQSFYERDDGVPVMGGLVTEFIDQKLLADLRAIAAK